MNSSTCSCTYVVHETHGTRGVIFFIWNKNLAGIITNVITCLSLCHDSLSKETHIDACISSCWLDVRAHLLHLLALIKELMSSQVYSYDALEKFKLFRCNWLSCVHQKWEKQMKKQNRIWAAILWDKQCHPEVISASCMLCVMCFQSSVVLVQSSQWIQIQCNHSSPYL